MMTRDEFKSYAAGVYYHKNCRDTVDFAKLEAFVDGATMTYDYLTKFNSKKPLTLIEGRKNELIESTDDDIATTHGVYYDDRGNPTNSTNT